MIQAADRQIILNFHGIGIPHEGVAAGEAPYWLSERHFAKLVERVAAHRTAGRDIRITFDDGNRSDLEIAAPLLAARGMSATFFLLTGRFRHSQYLSEDDARRLMDMGMGIGLHGRDHVDWRGIYAQDLEAETVGARAHLTRVARRPVTDVSIPFGAYDRRIISHLKAQGFAAIYTSDGGSARAGARIRPRTSLRADMDDRTLEDILTDRQPPHTRLRNAASRFLRQRVV